MDLIGKLNALRRREYEEDEFRFRLKIFARLGEIDISDEFTQEDWDKAETFAQTTRLIMGKMRIDKLEAAGLASHYIRNELGREHIVTAKGIVYPIEKYKCHWTDPKYDLYINLSSSWLKEKDGIITMGSNVEDILGVRHGMQWKHQSKKGFEIDIHGQKYHIATDGHNLYIPEFREVYEEKDLPEKRRQLLLCRA